MNRKTTPVARFSAQLSRPSHLDKNLSILKIASTACLKHLRSTVEVFNVKLRDPYRFHPYFLYITVYINVANITVSLYNQYRQ